MEQNIRSQINISIDPETIEILDELVQEDTKETGISNRSYFLRRLIRLEKNRREEAKAQISFLPPQPKSGTAIK